MQKEKFELLPFEKRKDTILEAASKMMNKVDCSYSSDSKV